MSHTFSTRAQKGSPHMHSFPTQPGRPDTLPFKICPKCGGRLHIETVNTGRRRTIWDANCISCGTTAAQWLPGQATWTPLYDGAGKRIPNPHNVPDYGEPEPEAGASSASA